MLRETTEFGGGHAACDTQIKRASVEPLAGGHRNRDAQIRSATSDPLGDGLKIFATRSADAVSDPIPDDQSKSDAHSRGVVGKPKRGRPKKAAADIGRGHVRVDTHSTNATSDPLAEGHVRLASHDGDALGDQIASDQSSPDAHPVSVARKPTRARRKVSADIGVGQVPIDPHQGYAHSEPIAEGHSGTDIHPSCALGKPTQEAMLPSSEKTRTDMPPATSRRKAAHRSTPVSVMPSVPLSEIGHTSRDIHDPAADLAPNDDVSLGPCDTHDAAAHVVSQIIELWRQRQDLHRAEKSLTLQMRAICRRLACKGVPARELTVAEKKDADTLYKAALGEDGAQHRLMVAAFDFILPFSQARAVLEAKRGEAEKALKKMAKDAPAFEWADGIKNLGALSFAAIIGEAGDISKYGTVSKLWKRMGLAVINGERQRKIAGDAALLHGYSPQRRSVMWNVGCSLIGGMGRGPRPGVGEDISLRADLTYYQKLFIERLRYEATRDPEKHAKEPVVNAKTGELRESFSKIAWARAKRYAEKRLLKHLWRAWREAMIIASEETGIVLPPAEFLEAAE